MLRRSLKYRNIFISSNLFLDVFQCVCILVMRDFYFQHIGVKLNGMQLLDVIFLISLHILIVCDLIVLYKKSKNIVLLVVKYDMLFERNIDEINAASKKT